MNRPKCFAHSTDLCRLLLSELQSHQTTDYQKYVHTSACQDAKRPFPRRAGQFIPFIKHVTSYRRGRYYQKLMLRSILQTTYSNLIKKHILRFNNTNYKLSNVSSYKMTYFNGALLSSIRFVI